MNRITSCAIPMIILIVLLLNTTAEARMKSNSSATNPYLGFDGIIIDIRDVANAVPGEFLKAMPEENDYYLVKFTGPVLASWRRELAEKTERILWYIPHNTFVVKMSKNQRQLVEAMPHVYWVGIQQPYFKLSRQMRELLANGDYGTRTVHDRIKIIVVLYSGESSENIKNTLATIEGTVIINEFVHPHDTRIIVEIKADHFMRTSQLLAFAKQVESIDFFRNQVLFNDAARWMHQKFVNGQYPLYDAGLRGAGQIGGIADSGFDYDMCYFRDTALGVPPFDNQEPWGDVAEDPLQRKMIMYYSMDALECGEVGWPGAQASFNDHGTHTLGSFVSDNFSTACTSGNGDTGDGMALCSKVVVQDMGESLQYVNIPCGTTYDLLTSAYQDGARVHTNSWGSPCNPPGNPCGGNFYAVDARDADLFMWEHNDIAVFFAAGNSSLSAPDSTVTSPGTAKNGCTIGATLHGTLANAIFSQSSKGWTYDMRMKPDFTAQGADVVSANNDGINNSLNCVTTIMGGTSMAAPTAAGFGLITRQYYTDGYYPSGSPDPLSSFIPSGALIKATMINSATDMTGVSGQPPNITEGWGRLKLADSLYLPGDERKLWIADVTPGLNTNMSRCFRISNNNSSIPLKATLVWTDYPAAFYASPALVNDLMLEVTNPAGNTTYHVTLDANYNIVQTANPADPQDDRNNVEQVLINNPDLGIWNVKVKGINVPQPAQKYALVVTGDILKKSPPHKPLGVTATPSGVNQIAVNWTANGVALCYNVYRSTGACPGTVFEQVASCITGNSFIDTSVSGDSTYAYTVTSVYASACESDFSACADATATGTCLLPPSFAGISAVTNDKTSLCGLTLHWDPATSNCTTFPDITYTIYKSTEPDFVPAPSNMIADCVTGISYNDTDVVPATTYYYVVRAEDSRTGGGTGPCNGGNFETNTIKKNNSPTGPESILFEDTAGDTGSAQMQLGEQWEITNSRNHTPGGTSSYYSGTGDNNLCSYLTSPAIALTGGNYYFAEFYTTYNLEAGWDATDIEISTDNGTNWTKITPVAGYQGITNNSTTTCIGQNEPCFTGNITPEWKFYTVNLTPYAEQTVLFRFRFGSDDAMNLENFYADDIRVMSYASCWNDYLPPGKVLNDLAVSKLNGNIELNWNSVGGTCLTETYAVYRGILPWTDYNQTALSCTVTGLSFSDTNATDSYYYLVVPANSATEGSYGTDSSSNQIPQSPNPCMSVQDTTTCN